MKLREKYQKQAIPEMKKKFRLTNDLEVPKILKAVINVGMGKYLKDNVQMKEVKDTLDIIAGQKTVLTKSKKSIAGFKIRQGLEIGAKVTLRGKRMWDFMERLVESALPRTRDFHGLKIEAVDKSGNLNIGIKEHLIFPEVAPEKVKTVFGLQINVVTNARNREKGLELFRQLGFPIENK